MRVERGALESLGGSLVEAIERLTPADGAVATEVPGLQLVRYVGPALVACNVVAPTLALVAQGAMSVDVGRETFAFVENTSLLTPIHVPATTRITRAARMRPFLGCVVSLDMAAAREMLAESVVRPAGDSGGGSAVARVPLSADLLDALLRLIRLNDRPEDVPVLGKLLHREILYRLLTSSYAGVMRQIATNGTQRQRIARTVDWLRLNFRRPLSVEGLAARAHMAVSTFHLHFRKMTGSSPLQFQKQLRLFEARRWDGRGVRGVRNGLRERDAVQSRIPPTVRTVAEERRRCAPESGGGRVPDLMARRRSDERRGIVSRELTRGGRLR